MTRTGMSLLDLYFNIQWKEWKKTIWQSFHNLNYKKFLNYFFNNINPHSKKHLYCLVHVGSLILAFCHTLQSHLTRSSNLAWSYLLAIMGSIISSIHEFLVGVPMLIYSLIKVTNLLCSPVSPLLEYCMPITVNLHTQSILKINSSVGLRALKGIRLIKTCIKSSVGIRFIYNYILKYVNLYTLSFLGWGHKSFIFGPRL